MLGAVTLIDTVHVPPAAMVPFVNETEVAFPAGAKVGTPHPLVVGFGVVATLICAGDVGRVSENWTLDRALFRLGFVMVNVNVEVPLARIGLGANNLEMLGGFKTVREEVAIPLVPLFVPPSLEETKPLTLSYMPEAVVVTVTLIVQLALAASVPPPNEIVRGAVVVSVPPHCVEEPEATVRPLGKVSVKLTPVKATPVFGFVTVNVKMDVAPIATGFGEKALLMVAGVGVPQPVKVTLSKLISFPLDVAFAPYP